MHIKFYYRSKPIKYEPFAIIKVELKIYSVISAFSSVVQRLEIINNQEKTVFLHLRLLENYVKISERYLAHN